MLQLRVGTIVGPDDVACAYCSGVLPALEEFYVIETQPIHKSRTRGERVENEFTITCARCLTAIQAAARKHKIPIKLDIDLPFGTRGAIGFTLIDR